ncbi:MAG: hypothetical protein HZB91_04430 [Elusimicrobia bacterium]|nr:hypothetical protein [Elusimicrobiota bacterium]
MIALAGPILAQAPDKASVPAASRDDSLSIVDFVPSAGHFRRGQWRKGSSDVWNAISVLWFILEPSTSIDKMEKDRNGYRPGSRRGTSRSIASCSTSCSRRLW